MNEAVLARMRELWDTRSDMSAAAIALELGVTKNVVMGRASRGGWSSREHLRSVGSGRDVGPEPRTLFQRLDALDAALDAVLAQYPSGYGRRAEP